MPPNLKELNGIKKKVWFQKLCNSLALGLYSDNDNFEICTYYDNM